MSDMLHDPKLEDLARRDPRKIIESMFFIVNKAGKKVPFLFNAPQNLEYVISSCSFVIIKVLWGIKKKRGV